MVVFRWMYSQGVLKTGISINNFIGNYPGIFGAVFVFLLYLVIFLGPWFYSKVKEGDNYKKLVIFLGIFFQLVYVTRLGISLQQSLLTTFSTRFINFSAKGYDLFGFGYIDDYYTYVFLFLALFIFSEILYLFIRFILSKLKKRESRSVN